MRHEVARLQRQSPGGDEHIKTIHAWKDLEADHVIVLNVNNAKMGILSMIVDDSLLSLVSPNAEP